MGVFFEKGGGDDDMNKGAEGEGCLNNAFCMYHGSHKAVYGHGLRPCY